MFTTEWTSYIYMCEKIVNISYQFFQKKKKCLKIFMLLLDTSPTLVCIDNGGARESSHIVILFNPLRLKSELNEIYHCNRFIS